MQKRFPVQVQRMVINSRIEIPYNRYINTYSYKPWFDAMHAVMRSAHTDPKLGWRVSVDSENEVGTTLVLTE